MNLFLPLHLQGRGTSGAGGGALLSIRRARKFRKMMSPPERRLWNVLKQRLDGFKFRRQHELGPYYLDFYCFEAALGVEVDGLQHEYGNNPEHDRRRDEWLASRGVRTVRVKATDVRDNLEGVVVHIVQVCQERSPIKEDPTTASGGPPPLDIEGRRWF